MKNGSEGIRTIGLILEDAFTDFGKEVIQSVSFAMRDRNDLRLVIISGRQFENEKPGDKAYVYKFMYNQIYMINDQFRFDGVMMAFPNLNPIQKGLYADIPRVFMATELENELTVNYDSELGIREALDYLVKIKGKTKLCMLGGRDENADAQKRKVIFQKCLRENGLVYTEDQYEPSDMSVRTQEPAARLLARNPDVQGIFCANDASASGLYDVMHSKGLVPGKDIIVFGFDNASIAADLVPPLASIGTDGAALGQKALDMLLAKMDGQPVCSQTVPTRLYGRESFEYEMFDFTAKEMMSLNSSFVYNFFDNCFYRYRKELTDSRAINLRRLFYEILSRMLKALKNRNMSQEEYNELVRLIHVLFDNGIMLYTDSDRFVQNMSKLQESMNETQNTGFINNRINRLFSVMKNKAIQFQAFQKRAVNRGYNAARGRILDFMIWATNYGKPGDEALEFMIGQFDRMGLREASMFLYREPFLCQEEGGNQLPDTMYLRCVVKGGELYVIPEERQACPVEQIYDRSGLPVAITYPLFYGHYLFGVLLCGADEQLFDTGEFLASQLGRAIFLNWVRPE